MSRMLLYLDKPRQPSDNITAIYPIYEFDYQQAVTDGISLSLSAGRVRQQIIPDRTAWYAKITCENVSVLNRYLSTNIPHQMWHEGSIFKTRISPYVLDGQGIYIPNPEYFNFRAIDVGVRPDDWGLKPYYQYKIPSAVSGYSYRLYYNVKRSAAWDASAIYYTLDDRNSDMAKVFYTESGCRWNMWYGGDNTTSTGSPFRLTTYGDATDNLSFYNQNNDSLSWQGASGGWSGCTGTSFSAANQTAANKALILQGNNLTYGNQVAFFIHFTASTNDGDKEFYGVAATQSNSFADNAQPTYLYIWAFTEEFWGDSIIAGGGNEGVWGDVSTTGGGNGSFSFVSDNRGDTLQTSIEALIGQRADAILTTMSGYNKHVLTPTEFSQVLNILIGTDYIERFENYMYNPLSAVLAVNLIPQELCAEKTDRSILTASGFNISEHINFTNPPTFAENGVIKLKTLSEIDFTNPQNYGCTDSFADFEPYTKAILHLPYIGELEISVNAFAHGKLKVTYVCDNISGNCVAFVWCSDKFGNCTYKYTVSGNCAYTLPIFADRQDGSAVGKLIGSAIGVGVGALSGNVATIVGGITGITSGLGSMALSPRTYEKTGAFGGNVGIIGDTICWLEIIHPLWVEPANYRQLNGIPSEISGTLYDDGSENHTAYDGYTLVSEIHLENVDCTDNEKVMIEAALKRGVHIKSDRYPI